jgi:hypothetical protein
LAWQEVPLYHVAYVGATFPIGVDYLALPVWQETLFGDLLSREDLRWYRVQKRIRSLILLPASLILLATGWIFYCVGDRQTRAKENQKKFQIKN